MGHGTHLRSGRKGACNLTMNSDGFVAATFSSEFAPDFSLQPASESLFVPRGSQVTDVNDHGAYV